MSLVLGPELVCEVTLQLLISHCLQLDAIPTMLGLYLRPWRRRFRRENRVVGHPGMVWAGGWMPCAPRSAERL